MVAYDKYINSDDWKKKRKARLELDEYKCRLCDEDGSKYQLEVHHRPSSYVKIPNESIENDLITVCSRCHEPITSTIRGVRYSKKEFEPVPMNELSRFIPPLGEKTIHEYELKGYVCLKRVIPEAILNEEKK